MKKILILILTIIILFFAYSEYKEYQRFHPKNANYKISKVVDLEYHNQTLIYDYNEAIATLNGFVISQWSANEIDVRNPKEDNVETQYAVNLYAKKIAKVKFYEAKLERSKILKEKGYDNSDIKIIEAKGLTKANYLANLKSEKFKKIMIKSFSKDNLIDGEKSAFVYEIQKLLVKKGFNIPLDGVYKNITREAIKSFEEQHKLFADGKLDLLTLDLLLN